MTSISIFILNLVCKPNELNHTPDSFLRRASVPLHRLIDRYEALTNVHNFNLTAVLVGCSGILMLWVFKKLNQRYLPGLPLPSQVKG